MGISTSPSSQIPILQMKGICKHFPGILANDHIDLDIYSSEIHALLGENGAGKSTLMKILYGFYHSDSGEILFNSQPVEINSPHDARELKIGMVFQDLNLIPALTVAENIALFLPDLKPVIDHQQINKKIEEISTRYDLQVNPRRIVAQLSIGEQQKVEILKLLLSNAKILILDEPTRVLAPHEIDGLFRVLDKLKTDGYAVVIITHKLKEVFKCADRITVLRAGKVAGTKLRSDVDEKNLIQLMFDKDITHQNVILNNNSEKGQRPILELNSLFSSGEGSSTKLKNVNLKIYPGEIVGVAGVAGNGQKELGDVILGIEKTTSGTKAINDIDVTNKAPGVIRNYGVSYIPENPLTMATVPYMSVLENMSLTRTKFYSKLYGFGMDWKQVKEDTTKSLNKFGFTFSPYVPAKTLSGGNLQRLIIAREMMSDPHLIVTSYLTRGLDVQSAQVARQELINARNAGAGILLISEDLEELFTLSDRLIVLFNGEIVGEFLPSEIDVIHIGHLMTGSEETQHA